MVWGALSDTKLSTLQTYQNRGLDLVESARVKDAWNKSSLKVNQMMTHDRAVMTYKSVNELCPEGLQNQFIKRSVISKCNTRSSKGLHVQRLKLENTKQRFLCTGLKAWNSIPQPIRERHRIHCTIGTKALKSPLELTDTRCTNPWKF